MLVIFRERFFVRARFVKVDDNKIYYTPTRNHQAQWHWRVPPQMRRTEKPIGEYIEHFADTDGDVTISDLKALKKQAGKSWTRGTDIGALLKQMPHDWYLNLGFNKDADFSSIQAITLQKKDLAVLVI